MPICKIKGRERGAYFEIQCVKSDIIAKELEGEDTKFERSLLRAWGQFKGWESALDALASLGKSKSRGVKPLSNGLTP